ncbi:hypothetical protein VOLCADRAFT_96740 [Volvox carteri f. nagariensis]|uniref:Prenylcysteine lyase domain-containing protein n=1 Tax=Volvox carteri f. nagariensis TaxID=3068 RepID=D8UAX4_VOLCA|nr:uncharacterized protein VOLCADRAFT_96740 [Volvox carteri f. nagariensis]EFJ43009.1 hypothetical protein VOLCADRAFT_96740 [Volvox carteri f. nagariensis]|eukprot:XP_002955808.1 hypothetical protein VOLCADRAFT_96740 [Volvox carteri f. nagariensis]
MQAAGTTWNTPDAMLRDLELFNETQQRCSDFMKDWLQQPLWWLWGGAEFADEVAGAANRCNYNQNNEQMNALAGLVSYMPIAYGAVFQIEGGNRQVVSGLLAASGAQLFTASRVTMVRRRQEDGRYFLEVRRSGGIPTTAAGSDMKDGMKAEDEELKDKADAAAKTEAPAAADAVAAVVPEDVDPRNLRRHEMAKFTKEGRWYVFGPYDAVVIATPLLGSGIQFDLDGDGNADNGDGSREAPGASHCEDTDAVPSGPETVLHQPYQVTVTTYIVAERLRAGYFNVVRVPPVERVFVTSDAQTPFSSVAMKRLDRVEGVGDGGDDGGGSGSGSGQRVFKINKAHIDQARSQYTPNTHRPGSVRYL